MKKGDTVYIIRTEKGEVIQKFFDTAEQATEYARENKLFPCIVMTGEITGGEGVIWKDT